jgi:DNA mismatch endonuclease (patch repair protein)
MDILSKEQRRKTMQAIKSKDSKIEIALRKALWHRGFRYRKHYNKLNGKPDIVFPALKIAIFCDSEFWHGYDWENRKRDIKSNQEFWFKKIQGNIDRDREINNRLTTDGWSVIRFWGKEIENNLNLCVNQIELLIKKKKDEEKV